MITGLSRGAVAGGDGGDATIQEAGRFPSGDGRCFVARFSEGLAAILKISYLRNVLFLSFMLGSGESGPCPWPGS